MKKKHFSVDARIILNLGRESIKDHTTALLELVKNSYDADATKVIIEIFCKDDYKLIRVADNGIGMTEEEVDLNWLRIGYSAKRLDKFTTRKRRKTGEKGIGRISTDRLGAIVKLKTKAKNSSPYGLKINWDEFDIENRDLASIGFDSITNPVLKIPTKNNNQKSITGTEIIIHELRQPWNYNDVKNLYEELSILTPPFKKVKDFQIELFSDVTKEFNGVIESQFYNKSEIELNAEFINNDQSIKYNIKDRYNNYKPIKGEITWNKLSQRVIDPYEEKVNTKLRCGAVKLKYLFYPRTTDTVLGTNFSLSDLRNFLDTNYGVKIYRDHISVKPYGYPRERMGDWLGLAERRSRDPAGISRPGYRVNANSLVGAVFISRDQNKYLKDSAGREGLVANASFHDLRAFSLGILSLLETYRHELYRKNKEEKKEKKSSGELIDEYKNNIIELKQSLTVLKNYADEEEDDDLKEKILQLESSLSKSEESQKSIEELLNNTRVISGLASLGISSAVFGHEIQTSVSEFKDSTDAALELLNLNKPKIDEAIEEIEKAQVYSQKVHAWGSFSLSRIKRDKRTKRKANIKKIISDIILEMKQVFDAVNIELDQVELEEIEGKVFKMDVETILLNLLTNSYTAVTQKSKNRKIKIALNEKIINSKRGFNLSVSDSGSGIDEKLLDVIWEPLFTTKKDIEGREVGTGLGLTIINSVIEEVGGIKKVYPHSKLGGAKFVIWLPI